MLVCLRIAAPETGLVSQARTPTGRAVPEPPVVTQS